MHGPNLLVSKVSRYVVLTVHKAGGYSRKWKSNLYNVPLIKNNGVIVKILAMGMAMIKESLEAVDNEFAAQLFPDVDRDNLIRPIGQLDLLIRIQDMEIHPVVADKRKHRAGNICLLTLQFKTREKLK